MSINVGTAEAYLNLNYKGFSEGIQTATQQLQTLMNSSESSGARIEALGGVLSSIGSALSKTVTPGIMAISAASVNAAASFESSMSNVQALSGATGEELERLSETAKKFGATTQFSASECSDAFGYMALAGWNTEQMISGLPGVLDLAAASSMQLSEASDILTDYISAFSLTAGDATHVADLMAYAQANSNTSTQQLADAFKNCAANANAYGYSMEETTGLLAAFADQGLKSGEAGTALNAIMRDMVNSMKDGAIKIGDTNVAITDASGNFLSFADIVNGVQSATDGMSESQRATALSATFTADSMKGMNLALAAGSDKIAKFTNELYNCDGAANDMAKTMQDNLKGKITQLKSALEGAGIAIGEELIPALTDIVNNVTDVVSSFNDLDDGTKNVIVKFGLAVAAAGPLISIASKMTTGFGSVITAVTSLNKKLPVTATEATGVSKALGILASGINPLTVAIGGLAITGAAAWHEYSDAMNSSALKAEEDYSTFERVMAQLSGISLKTKDELVANGEVYAEWADNVPIETQKVLDDITEKSNDINFAISQISFDGVISDDEINQTKGKVNEWCQAIIDTINTNADPTYQANFNLFNIDGIIDIKEQELLDKYGNVAQERVNKVQEITNDINTVIETGYNTQGEIIDNKEQYIKAKTDEANKIALESQFLSQEQQKAAAETFYNNIKDITAKGLSAKIQEEFKAKEERIQNIHDENDEMLAAAQTMYDKANEEDKAFYKEKLEQAKQSVNDKIKAEEDGFNQLIEIGNTKYPEYMKSINKYTGEELSNLDIKCREKLEKEKSYYSNLNSITEDGVYNVFNKQTQSWDELVIKVDEATGDIIGMTKLYSDESGVHAGEVLGYNADIRDSMIDLQSEYVVGVNRMILSMGDYAKAIKDGSKTTSEVMAQISADIDSGKLKIEDFGFSSKEQFLATAEQMINAKVKGEDLTNVLKSIPEEVKSNVIVNGLDDSGEKVKSLRQALAEIDGKTYTATLSTKETVTSDRSSGSVLTGGLRGALGNGNANGSDNALPGISSIAEYGPELVVGKSGLDLYTSRAVVGLEGGETIYNARQTNEILKDMNEAFYFDDKDIVSAIKESSAEVVKAINKSDKGQTIHADVMNFNNEGSKNANISMVKRMFASMK